MKLKNCVDITSGYSASRLKNLPSGEIYSVVSASNISEGDLYINIGSLNIIKSSANFDTVQTGDILLTNRNRVLAAIVPEGISNKLITKDFISIMRINKYFKDDILPEYLAILIKSDTVQRELMRNASTSVRSVVISNSAILDLEVIFPDIHKQKSIVMCYNTINSLKQNYAHKIDILNSIQKGIS